MWASLSPDSAQPIAELRFDARWNAACFLAQSEGASRLESWRAADAAVGKRPARSYINYDLDEDEDE